MNIVILMTTYNGEEYVEEQLKSLFNQTINNFKVIISDDDSSDRTLEIITKLKKIYHHQIEIRINKPRKGHCYNFLSLLNGCDADYIFFCDQDDIWEKDKIESTLKEMKKYEKIEKEKPIVLHTDQTIINYKGEIISDSSTKYFKKIINFSNLDEIAFRGGIHGCTMLLNKQMIELLKKIKIWECKNLIYHDWSIAIIAYDKGKLYYKNDKTMKYRVHNQNASLEKKQGLLLQLKKVKENNRKIYKQYDSILNLLNKDKKIEIEKLVYYKRVLINFKIGSWRYGDNLLKKIIRILFI